MQRTENVTSPKQVYRGPYYQKPTGENHHYTHNPGKSARHWACGRQALPNRVTSELSVIREKSVEVQNGPATEAAATLDSHCLESC
jgi:hypothetical protein